MRLGAQHGFTLVELVVVVMLLGILSFGTVQFINDSSSGLSTTISRTELAGDARFAIQRIAREVRDALPNSVRVTGGCIEFVPIVSASRYSTLPLAAAASSFKVVPFDPVPASAARAAVYPGTTLYALGSTGAISDTVSLSGPDASNEVTLSMASAHRFPSPSPTRRVFLVSTPVSYCVDGGRLWRYRNYGFSASQLTPVGLPGTRPNRALLAESVTTLTPFTIDSPSLSRNAVLQVDISFQRGSDVLRIEDQVQVRNVP